MSEQTDLMKPRYKATGTGNFHYPNSPFTVDQVIELKKENRSWLYEYYDHDGQYVVYQELFDSYKHLFKPLPWWSERKPEEMPQYVKRITEPMFITQPKFGEVLNVLLWTNMGVDGNYAAFLSYPGQHWKASNFIPATESEYLNHVNKSK